MSRPDYRMTDIERTAFVATLYDFQRSDADRHVREAEREVTRWFGYTETLDPECANWALLIVDRITEERVTARTKLPKFTAWIDLVAHLRDLVEAKAQADLDEEQAWFDENPTDFTGYKGAHAVVDGKVVHPWGTLLDDALNLFDILTPMYVWQVQKGCLDAGIDSLRDSLREYASGDTGTCPAKAVATEFDKQMKALDKHLAALRQTKTALAA